MDGWTEGWGRMKTGRVGLLKRGFRGNPGQDYLRLEGKTPGGVTLITDG